MRIGYITYGLDRSPMGIGRYVIELLRALVQHHPTLEMVLLTTEPHDVHGLWAIAEHHALPGCRLSPALMSIGNVWLPHLIQRHHLDVVHDPNGIVPFFGQSAGATRIATLYDTFGYVCPQQHNWLDTWRYRWLLPAAVRHADHIITISECSRQDLCRYLPLTPAHVSVTPLASSPLFCPVPHSAHRCDILRRYHITPPYILYVGGINARKNLARLFEAYAIVRLYHPDVPLVVVGRREWHTADIDAIYHRYHLAQNIHYTGYVPTEDMPALYSAAQLFVFPSLYEGFGLPPLEAMACGTPVVVSNTSSLPEVVGNAALLVNPHERDDLVRGMRAVLENTPLAESMRQRGLAQAQQFSWRATADATAQIYSRQSG